MQYSIIAHVMKANNPKVKSSTPVIQKLKPHIPAIVVCALIVAYGLYFSIYTLTRHHALMTQSDLGIFSQALWNTLKGDLLRVTIRSGNISYLQHHFAPSVLLLAPLYAIWSSPAWLLILQSIIIASGAWPIYQLAKDLSGRDVAGIVFALVYLLFPALQAANLYDFHALTIAAPLLIWSWYFARSRRWLLFAITSIIALGLREEVVIFMLGMSLIIALDRTTRKIGLITLVLCGIWLIVLIFVSFREVFFITNASIYLSRAFNLGDTPSDVLTNIISSPRILHDRINSPVKLKYLFNLFAPVGFLSIFTWQILPLVVPGVVLNLLGENPLLFSHAQAHYNALLAPFIVYTAAVGYSHLVDQLSLKSKYNPRFWGNILLVFVIMLSYGIQLRLAHIPYSPYFKRPMVSQRHKLAREIAKQIPLDHSLSTLDNLVPHVSHRRDLYVFPRLEQAEYVYLDIEWIEAYREAEIVDLTPQLEQILGDPQYETLVDRQGLILLQRLK